MMTRAAIKAIREGFRVAWRARPAVWIPFLANLGLAALASLPIYHGILSFTGYSLMSQALASSFSTDWLTDFSINRPGALDSYAKVILWLGLLALPVNSLLAGGVLASFRVQERSASLGDFFRGTKLYGGRLLRLLVIGLICYWIIFRVLNQALGGVVDRWSRDWLDDRPVFWLHLGVYLLVLLGLAFVNLVMDYARVRLVIFEGSSAVEAFLASLGFTLRRFGRALAVYTVPSLSSIALLILYRLLMPWGRINAYLGEPLGTRWVEPLTIAALFLGQQLVMFGRYWFRVAAWAGEWSLLQGSRVETRSP